MNQPAEVSNFLNSGDSQAARDRMKESVRALRQLVEYGEIKIRAREYRINLDRAYKLLQGKITIKDHDHDFIMALYDRALLRKVSRFDKLARLLS